MKWFKTIRVSLLLGKGHKLLERGKYSQALDQAVKAQQLGPEGEFEWLGHAIEGKARFHLGDLENARPALRKALAMLAAKLETGNASKPLRNIVADIENYLEKADGPGF